MTTIPAELLLVALALAIAGAVVALSTRRLWYRRKIKRRFERGRLGEARAARLLAQSGYDVLEEQTTRETGLWVDDAWQTVRVRADFLVERGDRQYVVEVKTGQTATRPTSTATRRQLFEYHHVYNADGLILADMEAQRLHLIRFDSGAARRGASRGVPVGIFALLLLTGVVLGAVGALLWLG